MRRHVLTLAMAGLFGLLLTAGEASACHKKARCPKPCAPVVDCCPVPACEPAPICEPAPCRKKARCGLFKGGLFKGGLCRKKPKDRCPEPCPPAPCATPVYYSVVTPSGQAVYPAPQGMPAPPSKQAY